MSHTSIDRDRELSWSIASGHRDQYAELCQYWLLRDRAGVVRATSRAVLLQPRSRALGVPSCYGAHSSGMRGRIEYGVSAAALSRAPEGRREKAEWSRERGSCRSLAILARLARWNPSAYLMRGHSSGLKRPSPGRRVRSSKPRGSASATFGSPLRGAERGAFGESRIIRQLRFSHGERSSRWERKEIIESNDARNETAAINPSAKWELSFNIISRYCIARSRYSILWTDCVAERASGCFPNLTRAWLRSN